MTKQLTATVSDNDWQTIKEVTGETSPTRAIWRIIDEWATYRDAALDGNLKLPFGDIARDVAAAESLEEQEATYDAWIEKLRGHPWYSKIHRGALVGHVSMWLENEP